jgi:hypothetical protein
LVGCVLAVLFLLLGVGYAALGDVRRERDAAERAVVVKKAPIAQNSDPLRLEEQRRILKHARAILEGSDSFGPLDNTDPIREQQYRELHQPLYKMNPRDR